jgi:hypothetical protein
MKIGLRREKVDTIVASSSIVQWPGLKAPIVVDVEEVFVQDYMTVQRSFDEMQRRLADIIALAPEPPRKRK